MPGKGRRFVVGHPGMGGRPRGSRDPTSRDLARQHRQTAIATIVALASDSGGDPRVRLAAALAIADRADGTPRPETAAEPDPLIDDNQNLSDDELRRQAGVTPLVEYDDPQEGGSNGTGQ